MSSRSTGLRSSRCGRRLACRLAQDLWDEKLRQELATCGVRVARDTGALNLLPKMANYENIVEGFPGVACSDSDNPDDYAAWSIAGAQADAQFGYFGRPWTWATSNCAEWHGFDRDRYMGPFTRATANPILVVGNTFDPATRYEGAQVVDRLMPRSRLLTVHGWGHTSPFLSQCADAAVARYLIEEATPPRGATCEQDAVPFASG